MKDNSPRLALLMKEAGLLSDALWEKYVASQTESGKAQKGLMDILKQDAFSTETYRNLFLYEFKLPFVHGGEKKETSLSSLNETLQITERELIQTLEANEPGIAGLHGLLRGIEAHLSPPQITTFSEAESMGRKGYNLLVRRGIFTPRRVGEIVARRNHPFLSANRVQLASDILAHNGLCSLEDFLAAFNEAQGKKKPVGEILEKEGKLNGAQLISHLKEGLDLPEADLSETKLTRKILGLFPGSFVRRHIFLPLKRTKTTLSVAIADPLYLSLCDNLSVLTGLVITPLYASHEELVNRINALYPAEGEAEAGEEPSAEEEFAAAGAAKSKRTESAMAEAPETPTVQDITRIDTRGDRLSAVQLVSSMVERAIGARATDIHIEPLTESVRVRYRIDGSLRHVMNLPQEIREAVTARIKVLANMNVTERRRPQDGSFGLTVQNGKFDFRVSVIPTHIGEKVVIRILDQRTVLKAMSELGMSEFQERTMRSWILKPYGIIMVTGPTGSGKSSTLYSCLNVLNEIERNIITIEDPVEYQLAGINQVQVDPNIDLTFATGLRSSLRQDPDVIMVGEIRDLDTARIAMRAALTGHLVFSTLHTNNAVGAVSALRHMGIQSYVISSAVLGIVAQRLVKMLCNDCKRRKKASPAMLRDFGVKEEEDGGATRWFWQAAGCDQCLNTGYLGRTAIFEMFVIDEKVRELITNEGSEAELTKAGAEAGLTTLVDSALEKVFAGVTSPDEMVKTVLLTQ